MNYPNIVISDILMTEEFTKIKYSFDERRQGITKTCYAECKFAFQPSEDFRQALCDLEKHVDVLLNYTNEVDVKDLDSFEENSAIVVTGIKHRIKPVSNTVEITGFIHSKNKQVRFTTPKIDLLDSDYKFLSELEITVDELLDEANNYINGKFDVQKTQLSLLDDPDSNTVIELKSVA